MQLNNPGAQLYLPDGAPPDVALARTTHLAVCAHQDDIPIGAMAGVLACFHQPDQWFTGVTVTNGAGSPRDDVYATYTDEQMRAVRAEEEKKAAYVGEYSACLLLDYPSSAVKDRANPEVVAELKAVVLATSPRVVYTHNFADKHDTHVAVALRVVQALREIPAEAQPQAVYGCEVWRDLDWMIDEDKVVFDLSAHQNLSASVMAVYDSQICGGKRYDLATAGRRRAHATYFESHGTDVAQAMNFAMDLTPLIKDPSLEAMPFVQRYLDRFAAEVSDRIGKMV